MVEQRPVVHIRRGDYVTLASARKTFGTLSSEYYHEALDRLGHQASDAVFFSDDPEFVRREFGVSPELVIGPSAVKSDLQTLMLMSLGQDIVIPNSTFSWWAAELMGKRGQVVAPKIWFYDRDESQWPQRQHWLRHDNK